MMFPEILLQTLGDHDNLLDVVGKGGVCALQAECKGLWAVGVP